MFHLSVLMSARYSRCGIRVLGCCRCWCDSVCEQRTCTATFAVPGNQRWGMCRYPHPSLVCFRSASSGETMSLRSDNATYGQRSLSGITHRQQPLSQLSQLLPLANRDPLSWRVSSPLYHPCRCSVHRTSNSGTRQGYTPRRCRPDISCTPVPRGCRQSRHP